MPAPLFSCAPDDHVSKTTSELEHAKHIDIPETMENNEEPIPTPLYHLSERIKRRFFVERQKAKTAGQRGDIDNQSGSDERQTNLSVDTNKSICPSSKNRFSIKSSDSELAVARLVSHHSIGVGDAKYS